MHQFPQPAISQPVISQSSISSASRRRLARHLVGLPLKDIERDLVLATLASTDGDRTASARLLGLSVRTLRKRITEYSADGLEVTPGQGRRSVGRQEEDDAPQSFAGTSRRFLQQDAIVGDALLEQATRDALRVRLRPVTPCDLAAGSNLSGNAERPSAFGLKLLSSFWPSRRDRGEIIPHRRFARRLISALAAATTMFR